MERDPEIGRRESDVPAERWDEEPDLNFSMYPPCPGIPSTPDEVAAADARGRADIAAGRSYPHAIVREWLRTWGSENYRPFQEWLAARDG